MLLQNITIIISNPNRTALQNCLKSLSQQTHKHIDLKIYEKVGDEPYCWQIPELVPLITSQSSYNAVIGLGNQSADLHKLIQDTTNDFIFWIDSRTIFKFQESLETLMQKLLSNKNYGCIYSKNDKNEIYAMLFRTRCIRQCAGVDIKYISTCSFALEEVIEKMKNLDYETYEETKFIECQKIEIQIDGKDLFRFEKKKLHPLYGKPLLCLEGAYGDCINARPLVAVANDYYICTKYPQAFNGLNNIKGFIQWGSEIGDFFGSESMGFTLYNFGDVHHFCYSLAEAYCYSYGFPYREENYNFPVSIENVEKIKQEIKSDKIICLGNFASVIGGKISNKNWPQIRWFQIVDFLKKFGYTVIQIGSMSDWKLPNVDYFFADRDIMDVSALLSISQLCICIDSFVHHLASIVGTKCLGLMPAVNQHAQHYNNIYISHEIEGVDKEERNKIRWWLDAQQTQRKIEMEMITIEEVKEKIIEILN